MERTTAFRAFHHHHSRRQGHLEPIAQGEMVGLNGSSRRLLTDQQTLLRDLILQPAMVAGVNPLKGSAEHGYRPAPLLQTAPMGGGVDTFRQTTHHRPATPGQGGADGPGHRHPMG